MEEKKKSSGKRVALIIICCVLAVILAALVALTIWVKSFLGSIDRIEGTDGDTMSPEQLESILKETDAPDPDFTGPVINVEDLTEPTQAPEVITQTDNTINFLLVGQDRREGQPRQRSDAMILVTINKSAKTLTMTSFLRDTWVYIPGYYYERLNVPYAKAGGFRLLNETLAYNFGVSAEHNIEVDFSGFKEAIDLAGGVDISLTEAEANYLNNRDTSWTLTKGINHLTGSQALEYSRIRYLDSDFGRTSRQRTVLMTLIEKAKTLSFTELYNLVKGLIPMLTTDMTDAEILTCVTELAPLLSELTITSQHIPVNGAYENAWIDGKLVLYLSPENLEKNKQILKDSIGAE